MDELNPRHWVGQVVKTIEIIGKNWLTCLLLLFIRLFNKTVKPEQDKFWLQFRKLPLLFTNPFTH